MEINENKATETEDEIKMRFYLSITFLFQLFNFFFSSVWKKRHRERKERL